MAVLYIATFALIWGFFTFEQLVLATETQASPRGKKWQVQDIQIGSELFLQACSPNPQIYFKDPKQDTGALREMPNVVKEIKKSSYDRPFIVEASSNLVFQGMELTARLENFRDLRISTADGKILEERKVAGASSLYEVYHKGKVVAWGVGWHKNCGSYYNVDFTAFRVIFPVSEKTSLPKIHTELGSFHFKNYAGLNEKTTMPIFEGVTSVGTGGAADFHYYLPQYKKYDSALGLVDIAALKELQELGAKTVGRSNYQVFRWATSVKDFAGALDYLKQHGVQISQDMNSEWPGLTIPQNNPRLPKVFPWQERYQQCEAEIQKSEVGTDAEEVLSKVLTSCFEIENYVENDYERNSGFFASFGVKPTNQVLH